MSVILPYEFEGAIFQPPNAPNLADGGWARLDPLTTDTASKKWLKNAAVAIRLQ
jgi:hypothetical protein